MAASERNGTRLEQALASVVSRLAPHLKGSSVTRSAVEDVLGQLGAPDLLPPLRLELHDALEDARISVVDDVEGVDDWEDLPALLDVPDLSAEVPAPGGSGDPIAAARRRLELDRRLRPGRLPKVLLNAEEEVGLTLLARPDGAMLKKGEFQGLTGEAREAADALFMHNLKLAHSVCQKYQGQGLEYDDLVQSAMRGLLRAVERFDPYSGYKFSTYATHWLRQSITRAIANEGRSVRLPVHMWQLVRKVIQTRERLAVDGQPPSLRKLALACDIGEDKVIECLRLAPGCVSLDTPLSDDGFTLGDLVDAQVDKPEHIEVHGLFAEDVDGLLGLLKERESDVVRRRFGLAPYDEPTTLDEIGKFYGVTRERIRQIESKAMTKLRAALERSGHKISEPRRTGPTDNEQTEGDDPTVHSLAESA